MEELTLAESELSVELLALLLGVVAASHGVVMQGTPGADLLVEVPDLVWAGAIGFPTGRGERERFVGVRRSSQGENRSGFIPLL